MALKIGTSPLTGTVFLGKVNQSGTAWVGNKTDMTDEVIKAAEHLMHFNSKFCFSIKGQKYEMAITKIKEARND